MQGATGDNEDPKEEQQPDWEAATDAAIASCDGDPRATVKALLIANAYLERELDLTRPAVSYGYSRGWHRNRR